MARKPAKKSAAIRGKDKGGRPEHQPTKATREKVMRRKALGFSDDDIATELLISRDTLTKHYGHELRFGRITKKGEAFDMLWDSAKGGNVTAQKAIAALVTDRAPVNPTAPGAEDAPGPKNMALGKKAAAKIAAQTAGQGTEWQNDLMPGFDPAPDGKPN